MQRAQALPIATQRDFLEGRLPSAGSASEFRVVVDRKLRMDLLRARAAEAVQTPRGRQTIKPIIRLYTGVRPPLKQFTQRVRRKRGAVVGRRLRGAMSSVVSVEQMTAILKRLRELEVIVINQLEGTLETEITFLRERLGEAKDHDELERAHQALGAVLKQRGRIHASARVEAFRLAEDDESIEGRGILRYLTPEISEVR